MFDTIAPPPEVVIILLPLNDKIEIIQYTLFIRTSVGPLKNELMFQKQQIIDRVNEITNIDIFINWIEKNQIRVIATSQASNLNQKLKDLFIITLEIPPLKNRIEDTKALINKFSQEASSILEMPLVSSSKLITNISNNTHSLRKSIYFSYLFETIGENEILTFLNSKIM